VLTAGEDSIIGMGGIPTPRCDRVHARRRNRVQIGTQNFVDPFVWSKVLAGLTDYMTRHDVSKISDLIGTFDPTPKPVHA
jgi:dihydroorotate dehydrogenase